RLAAGAAAGHGAGNAGSGRGEVDLRTGVRVRGPRVAAGEAADRDRVFRRAGEHHVAAVVARRTDQVGAGLSGRVDRRVVGAGIAATHRRIDQPDPLRHRPVETGDLGRGPRGTTAVDDLEHLDRIQVRSRCHPPQAGTVLERADGPSHAGAGAVALAAVAVPRGRRGALGDGVVAAGPAQIRVIVVTTRIEHADLDTLTAIVEAAPDLGGGDLGDTPGHHVGQATRRWRVVYRLHQRPGPVGLDQHHVGV